MTIIDQYIVEHRDFLPDLQLAQRIGITVPQVIQRKAVLKRYKNKEDPKYDLSFEMVALLELIKQRKTGWAVEVAKERIKKIATVINQG